MTDEIFMMILESICNHIHKKSTPTFIEQLLAKSLDLINRQQAEIEELKNDTIPKLQESLKRANKYGLESDKENERLKQVLNSYALQYGTVTDQSKKIKEIKDEAYKEFAERLTDRIAEAVDISHDNPNGSNYDLTDVFDTIHNLVKELKEGK